MQMKNILLKQNLDLDFISIEKMFYCFCNDKNNNNNDNNNNNNNNNNINNYNNNNNNNPVAWLASGGE